MNTNNRKHVSLLVVLAMLLVYAVPFSIGAYADDDVELAAVDTSLGLTTISENYTFIASDFIEKNTAVSPAQNFDDNKVCILSKNVNKSATATIGSRENLSYVVGTKASNNYMVFNVADGATVKVYGLNTGGSAERYFTAGQTKGARDIAVSDIFSGGSTNVFTFETSSDTTVYITSYEVKGTAGTITEGTDSGGDMAIAGFTVEFEGSPSVTDTPTEKPTDTPTEKPTDTPTEKPTDTPTEKPTDTPTEKPTDTPTEKPTDTPTEKPTDTPTETGTPTAAPTDGPELSPDEQAVRADAAALKLNAISQTAVYADIDLDMKGINGSTITWESSNSKYIDIQTVSSINRNYTGVVTRPKEDECADGKGVPVTLTATLKKGDAVYTKEFDVSVRTWNPNVYYNDFQTDVGQPEEGTYKEIADGVSAANGKETFRGIRVDTLKESRCFANFNHQDKDTPANFDKRIMSTEAGGANYGRPADTDPADKENFAFYFSEYKAYGGSTTYTTLWINLIDQATGQAPAGIVMMSMDIYVIDGNNKLNLGLANSKPSQMCRFLLSNGSTTFKEDGNLFKPYPAAGSLRTFSNEAPYDFMKDEETKKKHYAHPTGKWVKATMFANSDTHKWDLYYDGMQICSGHDFRNAEDFVSSIEFTMDRNTSGGAYLIDNIYVENLTEDYADTYWDALMINSLPYSEEQDQYTSTVPFMLQYQGTDGLAGNAIKWSSSDSSVLSISTQRIAVEKLAEFGYTEEQIANLKANGYDDVSVTIANPNANLTEDKIITLTAKMETGDELKTKTFSVLVKQGGAADDSDQAKARTDANAISCITNGQTITDNVVLDTIGKVNGSVIKWKSSNSKVISESGIVTRPSTTAASVTLTATVKYGDAVEYKSFNVTVSPKTTSSSGGGGGGGGGGGSSSGVSGSSIAPSQNTTPVVPASIPSSAGESASTPRPAGMPAFDDLNQAEWAREAVEYLFYKDIVNGYGDGRYGVNDDVTREQFVRMLMAALNIKLPETDNSKFSDVSDNEWYTNYVNGALELGIVSGISDNEFGVGQPISRQDMAVMCMRALDKVTQSPEIVEEPEDTEEPEATAEPETTEEPETTKEPEATEEPETTAEPETTEEPEVTETPKETMSPAEILGNLTFGDKDEISEYALTAIAKMVKAGYLSGDDNGNFAPKKSSTRAETAVVLYRILIQEDI